MIRRGEPCPAGRSLVPLPDLIPTATGTYYSALLWDEPMGRRQQLGPPANAGTPVAFRQNSVSRILTTVFIHGHDGRRGQIETGGLAINRNLHQVIR